MASSIFRAIPSYSINVGKHAAARHAGGHRGPRWSVLSGVIGLGAASISGGLALGLLLPGLPALNWSTPVSAGTLNATPVPATAPVELPPADIEPAGDEAEQPEVFEPRTITILGVGDILVHREILQQARTDGNGEVDFVPQLEGIRGLVESVDFAVCHMEYPMGSPEGPWSVWPDPVNAPPQLADAVADVGFDACSTASNHTLAQGFSGVTSTIEALDRAGLPYAGTARSEHEADRIAIVDVQGVPIALLSYTYGFNGMHRPFVWCCNLIDNDRIVADAARARAEGAQLVVVSLHQGVEGVVLPTREQQTTVTALADSGLVDLVLGHHAHVVQPVTRVKDMWVAYGHGNLLSAQSRRDPRTGDGLLTVFTFQERPDGRFDGVAARGYALVNEDFPYRVIPVSDDPANPVKAEATWRRVSNQVVLPGDTSGFMLMRVSATSSTVDPDSNVNPDLVAEPAVPVREVVEYANTRIQ